MIWFLLCLFAGSLNAVMAGIIYAASGEVPAFPALMAVMNFAGAFLLSKQEEPNQ